MFNLRRILCVVVTLACYRQENDLFCRKREVCFVSIGFPLDESLEPVKKCVFGGVHDYLI